MDSEICCTKSSNFSQGVKRRGDSTKELIFGHNNSFLRRALNLSYLFPNYSTPDSRKMKSAQMKMAE